MVTPGPRAPGLWQQERGVEAALVDVSLHRVAYRCTNREFDQRGQGGLNKKFVRSGPPIRLDRTMYRGTCPGKVPLYKGLNLALNLALRGTRDGYSLTTTAWSRPGGRHVHAQESAGGSRAVVCLRARTSGNRDRRPFSC